MPSGRMQAGGGVGSGIREIPNLKSLTVKYVKRGYAFPEDEWPTIERQITEAISAYRALSTGSPAPTPTEARRVLSKITTRAKNLAEADFDPKCAWRESFLSILAIDPKSGDRPGGLHMRLLLADALRELGGVVALETLEAELESEKAISSEARQAVSRLAQIDLDTVITKSKWRNPHAEMLIRDLVPLWNKATGRTPLRTDGGGEKWRFRSWLSDISAQIRGGLPLPGVDELQKLVQSDMKIWLSKE